MLCLRPGPADVRTLTTPGVPPIRWEPRPAPPWPLTISCLVSASNRMVVLRASSSSVLSQSFACSQIQGGSVTWASQSKVGKSFVMGANCCTGMLHLLRVVLLWLYYSALPSSTVRLTTMVVPCFVHLSNTCALLAFRTSVPLVCGI